jgi:hypothetical protein
MRPETICSVKDISCDRNLIGIDQQEIRNKSSRKDGA